MSEWISIKNKLPDKNGEVLVSDGKEVWIKQFIATPDSFCAFTKPSFCYWDNSGDGYYIKTRQVITHWMPLPPPPTEKEKQND